MDEFRQAWSTEYANGSCLSEEPGDTAGFLAECFYLIVEIRLDFATDQVAKIEHTAVRYLIVDMQA